MGLETKSPLVPSLNTSSSFHVSQSLIEILKIKEVYTWVTYVIGHTPYHPGDKPLA